MQKISQIAKQQGGGSGGDEVKLGKEEKVKRERKRKEMKKKKGKMQEGEG